MTLIRTTVFTSMTTIAKLFAGFLINKALAIYTGPSGLAVVGQFKNFLTLVTTFSTGATNTGVTKYLAEYKDENRKQDVIQTSLSFALLVSIAISVCLLLFSKHLSTRLFYTSEYSYLFILLAATISLFSLNSLLLSILNGYKKIKLLTLANISNSVISLLITVLLIFLFNLPGALIALVINQSVVFFASIFIVFRQKWFNKIAYSIRLNKPILKKLIYFSLITFTSVLTGPTSLILVRKHIAETLSWEIAGYWEGVWQLSSMYLSFVTASLSVYYLPKMSELESKEELVAEVISVARVVLPVMVLANILIYFFRRYVTLVIFSESFLPMTDLYAMQLTGDFLKVASWILSYILIAKALVLETVITSTIANILFVCLVYIFVGRLGVHGATVAYTINYLVYLVMIAWVVKTRYLAKYR